MSAEFEVQRAVHAALLANPELMASITGIFDRPPTDVEYPYITIGDGVTKNVPSAYTPDGDAFFEHTVLIHVWCQGSDRMEAKGIFGFIHDSLHDAGLDLNPPHHLVQIRFEASQTFLDADGVTVHGVSQFKAETGK